MVGTSKKSEGGITSVIKMIKKMPLWNKYSIYWLATQCKGSKVRKLYYVIISAILSPFILWKYDIVHFHVVPGTGLYIQLPQLLFAKLYNKKTILEIHVGNQLEHYKESVFFIWWLKNVDRIIFLSDLIKSNFTKWYPNVYTKAEVLYNSCNILPDTNILNKKKIILMAAHLDDNKAPDLLIKAWKLIKPNHLDWKVIIMGGGEVEKFKRLSRDMNLDDIIFTGYLEGYQKEKYWKEASIYCMCSYEEGFPMVILEAWNYGLNVITTPVGAMPDFIEEGKNCLSFPFGDYKELSCKLERLMTDRILRIEMANYSRKYFSDRFSIYAINDKLEKIYIDLLH